MPARLARPARRSALALAVGLVLTGSLAACSDEPSQEEAEQAACQSLADVVTAAANVKALDTTSTVDEAEEARDELKSAVDGLKEAAADVSEADTTAIEDAYQTIADAIGDVSGGDTLTEAAATVQGSTGALDSALQEMGNGLGCAAATPGS